MIMKNYKLLVISVCFLIEVRLNKSEWVEVPQFSNNEKVYRTPFQLDRFLQSSRNESGMNFVTRPVIQSNLRRVDKFHKVSEIEKTVYRKGLENFIVNDTSCTTTVLPMKLTTESIKKSDTVTSIARYKNFEKNQNSKAEDDAPRKQLNQTDKLGDEVYPTCSTEEPTKISNFSKNSQKVQNLVNETKSEADKRFLYYLPITLFKKVHLILKAQPHTLKGKIKFLRNFEKVLLSEVETRLAATIVPYTEVKKSNRQRRYDHHHHDDDSLGFPSLEGALMAISFLTFAVYLVRLIMLLFQNFASTTGGSTLFLGRRKRSMNHENDDAERILSYLYK